MTGTVILSFAEGTDKPVPGADVCSKAGRGSALQRQMSRHNKRAEKNREEKSPMINNQRLEITDVLPVFSL